MCLVAFKVHRKLISFRFVSISQKTSMEFSLHVFAFLSAPTPHHTHPTASPTPLSAVIVVIIIVVAYNISNNNITSSPAAVVVVVVVAVVGSTFPWRFQCTTKNNVKRGQRAANEAAAQPAATPTAITLTAAAAAPAAARWGQRVEPWPGAASLSLPLPLSPLGLCGKLCVCVFCHLQRVWLCFPVCYPLQLTLPPPLHTLGLA